MEARMRPLLALLLLLPAFSGCLQFTELVSPYVPGLQIPVGQGEDTDLDGIPDAVEEYRQQNCTIANQSCQSLGITPPTVGVRDLILVHYIPNKEVAGYAVRSDSWHHLEDQLALHNISLQWTELGFRDDIDPEAIWEATPFPHATEDTVFWHVWVYPIPQEDFRGWFTAGQATLNWIEMKGYTSLEDQMDTLLHETYHILLGDLQPENQSECDGDPAHSRHKDSILYVNAECRYPSTDRSDRLNDLEADELAQESFENLRHMNQGVPVHKDPE